MLLETKHLQDFINYIRERERESIFFYRKKDRVREIDKMGVGRHYVLTIKWVSSDMCKFNCIFRNFCPKNNPTVYTEHKFTRLIEISVSS